MKFNINNTQLVDNQISINLITGGAGFIGSHLSDYLLSQNQKVIVIDNLILGKEKNIEHLYNSENFIFVKGDILDKQLLSSIFQEYQIDFIYHLAANSDIAKSFTNPEIDLTNTFLTTVNILECMKEFSVHKLFFASSSAIYGQTDSLISEDHGPLIPLSHYGACKLASEAIISSYVENYGLQAWIARFPNVVGEKATHGVIYDLINKLKSNQKILNVLGDGKQNKPYLYVKDLIEAFIYIIKESNERLNVFNLGTESRTKVSEIAQMVIEEMEINPTIIYSGGKQGWIGDVPEFQYDLSKIHNLGWTAKISSNEAVRKSIRYNLNKYN